MIAPSALRARGDHDERPTRRVERCDRRSGTSVSLRSSRSALSVLWLLALAGCSADEVHSPQDFFPGSHRSSWSACGKIGVAGDAVEICADLAFDPGTLDATGYAILFHIPNAAHVRIAVFNSQAALVTVLLDADEPANLPGLFRDPPIVWNFTDAAGKRVPPGDYRCYFSAGDVISTSDVEVP